MNDITVIDNLSRKVAEQHSDLEAAIVQGVDGIVLAPVEADALAPCLPRRAHGSGAPDISAMADHAIQPAVSTRASAMRRLNHSRRRPRASQPRSSEPISA